MTFHVSVSWNCCVSSIIYFLVKCPFCRSLTLFNHINPILIYFVLYLVINNGDWYWLLKAMQNVYIDLVLRLYFVLIHCGSDDDWENASVVISSRTSYSYCNIKPLNIKFELRNLKQKFYCKYSYFCNIFFSNNKLQCLNTKWHYGPLINVFNYLMRGRS